MTYLNGKKLSHREPYPGEMAVVAMMKKIVDKGDNDPEMCHLEADEVLCSFLISLGCTELLDLYNKVPKYYAQRRGLHE